MADPIEAAAPPAQTAAPVYVIDDDRDVRGSIAFLLKTVRMPSVPFHSGVDFVGALDGLQPGCILLDIRMPEMDGIEVLKELERREIDWPVIIMTGHGEIALAVQSMKLGAIDFLEKPFNEEMLLGALTRGQEQLRKRTNSSQKKREARTRIGALTEREREVLQGLSEGLSNKLIAYKLGISLRTAEMHRAHMMTRLGVKSLAEACRIVADAGLND